MTRDGQPDGPSSKVTAKRGSIGGAGRDATIDNSNRSLNPTIGSAEYVNITYSGESEASRQTGNEESDPGSEGKGADSQSHAMAILFLIAILLAPCVIFLSMNSDGKQEISPFPDENGTRPVGAEDAQVLSGVLAALTACADSPVLAPQHCPQRAEVSSGSEVRWRIRGSAGDGAIVRYNGAEGRFHVLGLAVMDVSYKSYSDEAVSELHIVKFWSRVEWESGKPMVVEIRSYDDKLKMPSVEKTDPKLPSEHAFRAVRSAFERCFQARKSPLPPRCPSTVLVDDKVNWKLHGNPTLNARASFDSKSGLIHVEGDYSATASYDVFLIGPESTTESGKYDAVLSIEAGKPEVLSIKVER
ncbi:hypothetical protein [Actinoplanes philippinensis]|uniref:hypothetical protein n=1 Tax=Actinoplanes philippinensis TaxID=35752 RepID=UPI0033CB4F18